MRKKILFVTNVNPFTASFGAEQRSYVFLQAFLQNGCDVDVAYTGLTKEDKSKCPDGVQIVFWNERDTLSFTKWQNLLSLATIRMYPVCKEQETVIDTLVANNQYDYIACRYIATASFAGLFKYADRLLLDIDDMPAPALAAQMGSDKWFKDIYHKRMVQSVANETKRWLRKSKACFLPHKTQAEQYGCTFLPNIPLFNVDKVSYIENCKNILFIGLMSFRPNWEGVDHFITHCWTEVVTAVPDAHFLIAGKGLSEDLRNKWTSFQNISVLGFVDSVTDFYSKGNIVIVPVYSGAGTNIKVIEAMAMGKATVLTPFSSKGYEDILGNGVNSFIANNEKDFSDHIVELLTNPQCCQSLATEGHKKAMHFYSQTTINNTLSRLIYYLYATNNLH